MLGSLFSPQGWWGGPEEKNANTATYAFFLRIWREAAVRALLGGSKIYRIQSQFSTNAANGCDFTPSHDWSI